MNLPTIDKDFKVPEDKNCNYPQCKCPSDHPGIDGWCFKHISQSSRHMLDSMNIAQTMFQAKEIADKYQPASAIVQPPPKPTSGPAVWSLVMRDMADRDVLGANRYGVRLQPGNGRDALKDAYEEALDLCAYLRQAMYERDKK